MTRSTQHAVAGFEGGRNGAKECGWHSEVGQVKKMGPCLQEKHIPPDILLFAQ